MSKKALCVVLTNILLIILCVTGTRVFQKEANPFAILVVIFAFSWYCLQVFSRPLPDRPKNNQKRFQPWEYAGVGMLGLLLAYEELRKMWVKVPVGKFSDVLPQLSTQCYRFFSGEYPYQLVQMPEHQAFPVYMPLHWAPIQLSVLLGIDIRWSGMILLLTVIGLAGYLLARFYASANQRYTLPFMLLFSLPVWAFILWGGIEMPVSLETIVAAYYLLLALGLATRNHTLITLGVIGGFLSRYTIVAWAPVFAILLWLNAPRKYSYWLWGSTLVSGILLFILPFWLKDPTIVPKIMDYYNHCADGSWLRPDEYTFVCGLSFNIHLRHWLPGTPESNIAYSHYPQIFILGLVTYLSVYYYQKKWKQHLNIYDFSLILLPLMTMLFYLFNPMLFQYYMLMPLTTTALLTWKAVAHGTSTSE